MDPLGVHKITKFALLAMGLSSQNANGTRDEKKVGEHCSVPPINPVIKNPRMDILTIINT